MSYEIKCKRCECEVTHICNEDFKKALIRLLSWVPEGGVTGDPRIKKAMKEFDKETCSEEIASFEDYPFFGSQAWSYLLFYKEEARTFHALLNNVIRAAGLDPHSITMEALRNDDER